MVGSALLGSRAEASAGAEGEAAEAPGGAPQLRLALPGLLRQDYEEYCL